MHGSDEYDTGKKEEGPNDLAPDNRFKVIKGNGEGRKKETFEDHLKKSITTPATYIRRGPDVCDPPYRRNCVDDPDPN